MYLLLHWVSHAVLKKFLFTVKKQQQKNGWLQNGWKGGMMRGLVPHSHPPKKQEGEAERTKKRKCNCFFLFVFFHCSINMLYEKINVS